MFLEHFYLSHPEDLPLRENQTCYRMKTSTDLRSNFKVFVNQELHRNKIHCWMKFTVYKIHPLGCLDAFGKEELAAARRNSVPGEADKELIPIFIFLFHFFLFPTSEVQVRFELPAALSLHLPNFRLSCRPQGLSGYQARISNILCSC